MQLNTEQQIQQVEISIEEAKRVIGLGEALKRLRKNKDFKAIVAEGYFHDEASRLALLSGTPHLDPSKGSDIYMDIRSIGAFYAYLHTIAMKADAMSSELRSHEAELEDLRLQDANGDSDEQE